MNFYGHFFSFFLVFFAGGIEAGLVLSAVISLLMLHFMNFDVPLHEMPSVSFHLNLETLKLLLSQSSCSQFFIEEDFSLLRLPPHVGRYKFSVRGKVMKL